MKGSGGKVRSRKIPIVERIPALLLLNPDGSIRACNQTCAEILRQTEAYVIGRNCAEIFDCKVSQSQLCPLVRAKEKKITQTRMIRQNGARIEETAEPVLDGNGAIADILLSFAKAGETPAITPDLAKIQKLESVWHVCKGVVHDLNNILTCVDGGLQLLKEDLGRAENHDKLDSTMANVESALAQGRMLTRQILRFGTKEAIAAGPLSLGDIIRETVSFSVLGEDIPVKIDISDCLWPVWSDPGQISQMISNLVINARHALDAQTPNAGIAVTADNASADEVKKAGLKLGVNYVRIVVEDTGSGIPVEHLDRIFEPFFTTKNDGTGLGLAIVNYIVQQHEGRITVDSKIGAGSRFAVYLPALILENETDGAKTP